jgi:hypothetical protein
MSTTHIKLLTGLLIGASLLSTSAHAGVLVARGWRGGVVAARGPHGAGAIAVGRYGGYTAGGWKTDGGGNYEAGRTVQGAFGRGYNTSASGHCGAGSCSGSRLTTFNDGKSIEHSYTATKNANGSVTYDGSRTGVNGQTSTVTRTFNPPPQ